MALAARLRHARSRPSWLAGVPVVGDRLANLWRDTAAAGAQGLWARLSPYAGSVTAWLAARAGGIGYLTVQYLLTLVLAAFIYANGEHAALAMKRLGRRLGGKDGEDLMRLAGQATRAVAIGVGVTALVQSLLGGIGLAIAGVPFALLLTALLFVLCIAQIGMLPVLIPAVIWVYWNGHPWLGTFLLVWSLIASLIDNVLRPVLVRRSADVPLLDHLHRRHRRPDRLRPARHRRRAGGAGSRLYGARDVDEAGAGRRASGAVSAGASTGGIRSGSANRRTLLLAGTLGYAAAFLARAERPPKVLGVLSPYAASESEGPIQIFQQAMRELGYTDKDYVLVQRFAEGRNERLAALAAELVGLHVDLILASTTTRGEGSANGHRHDPDRLRKRGRPGTSGFCRQRGAPGTQPHWLVELLRRPQPEALPVAEADGARPAAARGSHELRAINTSNRRGSASRPLPTRWGCAFSTSAQATRRRSAAPSRPWRRTAPRPSRWEPIPSSGRIASASPTSH